MTMGPDYLRLVPDPDSPLPSHDADAEAALLSSCMLDGDLVAHLPPPTAFYGEAHRRIADAIHAVHNDRTPVDLVTVGTWLKDNGRLAQVGGMGFLTELLNATPAVNERAARAYARSVREHAERRGLTDALRELAARSESSDHVSPADLYADAQRRLGAFGLTLTKRDPIPLLGGDLVRAMIGEKPLRRLVTGIATLDAVSRGGLPESKVIVLGGAPGAGKTTKAAQLASDASRAGWAVSFYVTDGPVEDVLQRFAQLDGFTREEFDERGPDVLTRIADRFHTLGFYVVDTERCRTIEDASESLCALRGGRPSLLVIDSAQTSLSRDAITADGPRARLDANMRALKHCARFDRHMVIATSELARGAYRSKNTADQIDDLAAFKESGGVEYAADLAIVLRSVKGDDDLVDVNVAKSRLGAKTPFRLQLDRRHMRFREVEMPSEEDATEERTASRDARDRGDVRAVERFLAEHPGVAGLRGLRTGLRAEGHEIGNARLDVALVHLEDRIENRGTTKRPIWHLRGSADPDDS